MSEKFRDIYRIETSRLKSWDYSWNGTYFITICTKNRENFFGKITDGIIELSEIGKIVNKFWIEIPAHFQYTKPGSFVIMPNHIHGIIIIDNKRKYNRRDAIHGVSKTKHDAKDCGNTINGVSKNEHNVINRNERDAINRVSTGGITGNKNPMLNDNLSRVVRWFKGRVTFESHKIEPCFGWQSRFYDHIIRDDKSHYMIQQYIENNVINWQDDQLYKS